MKISNQIQNKKRSVKFISILIILLFSIDAFSMDRHHTITTIINNKSKNVQQASEFPDFIRYQRHRIYDENGEPTERYENVPVRFIKKYYLGKNGEFVEKVRDAVVIIVEYFDKDNNRLLIKKEFVKQKK